MSDEKKGYKIVSNFTHITEPGENTTKEKINLYIQKQLERIFPNQKKIDAANVFDIYLKYMEINGDLSKKAADLQEKITNMTKAHNEAVSYITYCKANPAVGALDTKKYRKALDVQSQYKELINNIADVESRIKKAKTSLWYNPNQKEKLAAAKALQQYATAMLLDETPKPIDKKHAATLTDGRLGKIVEKEFPELFKELKNSLKSEQKTSPNNTNNVEMKNVMSDDLSATPKPIK